MVPGDVFPQYFPMAGEPGEPPFRIVTESHLQSEWFSTWKAVKVSWNTQKQHLGPSTSHTGVGVRTIPVRSHSHPSTVIFGYDQRSDPDFTFLSCKCCMESCCCNSSYLAPRQKWKRNTWVQNWQYWDLTIWLKLSVVQNCPEYAQVLNWTPALSRLLIMEA